MEENFAILKQMPKTAPLLLFLCATLFAQQGIFTDARDGKKYVWAEIGTQTWLVENLNYEAKGSRCYEDRPANCIDYGRLYNMETAKKVCPKNWHLPSKAEWEALVATVGGEKTAAKYLKATHGWNHYEEIVPGNGKDKFGFSALPGGYGADGYFYKIGYQGNWWNSSEYIYLKNTDDHIEYAIYGNDFKDGLFSVRCIENNKPKKAKTAKENPLLGLTGSSISNRYIKKEKAILEDSILNPETIISVKYWTGGYFSGKSEISVTKTTKGVIATNVKTSIRGSFVEKFSEIKLDSAQWRQFVKALQKCIGEWNKEYNSGAMDGRQWTLKIFFPDKENNIKIFGSNAVPSNWNEFMRIINFIERKTASKTDFPFISKNSRSKLEIDAIAYKLSLRSIYNSYLKQKPYFSGSIILKYDILPSGEVTNVEILSSTTDHPDFDKDIKNKIATFKYKEIESGNSTAILLFNFE